MRSGRSKRPKGGPQVKRRILKTIFSVTGVIIVAKLLGFVKQTVTASLFGATLETDLINLSQGLLGNLDYVLVHVLLTSFTALYIRLIDDDIDGLRRTVSDTLKVFTMIASVVAGLVFVAAPVIARILAPSYGAEDLVRLTGYIRLYVPILPLFTFSAVFTALLNSHKRFLPAELVSVNQSILSLLILSLFSHVLGTRSLILAFFTYTVWNLLFLGFLSRRHWRLELGGNPFANPNIKELLRMCAPLLLSYSMVFINQQVDKSLSSGLGEGTVTALGYASVLSNLVSTFIISFCSILFTYTATAISKGEHQKAAALAVRATGLLTIVFLPISLLTVLCTRDVVSIAFGRGAFNVNAVEASASALRGYGLLFVPLALREVFTRFQYGYQDTRRPTVASCISIACNIILSVFLSRYCGIFGIACATSVSVFVCGLLNLFCSRKLNRFLNFTFLLRGVPWILLASGACLTAAILVNRRLADAASYFRFPAAAFCGLAVYFLLSAPVLLKLLQERQEC